MDWETPLAILLWMAVFALAPMAFGFFVGGLVALFWRNK
jgi:hypothetical protein